MICYKGYFWHSIRKCQLKQNRNKNQNICVASKGKVPSLQGQKNKDFQLEERHNFIQKTIILAHIGDSDEEFFLDIFYEFFCQQKKKIRTKFFLKKGLYFSLALNPITANFLDF